MTTAHINRIATAVPPHDIHDAFVAFAGTLLESARERAVFGRLVERAQIAHRFSVLAPSAEPTGLSVDEARFYARSQFPAIAPRMRLYEKHAPDLAARAVAGLDLGPDARRITHVIVTSCTGHYAPGLDIEIVERCGLAPSVERTMVGFMGCYAAINALKLARHIVRSEATSRVLLVNLELCSLHLQETSSIEQLLSFVVFGDGCAASVVSADPVGLSLDHFHAALIPDTRELITWKIRNLAFDMVLSGRVPGAISAGLEASADAILAGAAPETIDLWAVHPGGRTVLDAVERGLSLAPSALAASRDVLARYGNMSSATVMFVLQSILGAARPGERGCAMSFGPGLTAETMLFHKAPSNDVHRFTGSGKSHSRAQDARASMVNAVVIGGGPAGAALATRISRAGEKVVLVEREPLPADKVCGEFLSREAGLYLTSLGLSLPALGAVPIDALRLCAGADVATVRLPFAAWSLSRRALDEALLALAAGAGATVRRGVKALGLDPSGDGFRARLDDGSAIEAGAAFLATGKHDLRGHKRPPGLQSDLLAFKQHFHLASDQTEGLSRHVELVLFEGGYAGLSLVEGRRANLCLLVRRRRFAELGLRWDRLLAAMRAASPHLAARLAGGEPCSPKPLALSMIPYGHVRRRSTGIWHLGDQAAVIPSFSGDGMSIALHSAELAAQTFLAGARADTYQRRLARDVTGQVLLSTGLSHWLVRRPGQRVLSAAARLIPGLVAALASHTRVSDAALARAGLAGAE